MSNDSIISESTNNLKQRNITIDFLKGIAIISVVFYHFGGDLLPYGYLGVDVFFVVGGYLLIKGIVKQFNNDSFNYWKFVFRKIVRLWPLVVLASVASVVFGYWFMLPDDYENLSQSAIASSAFANNILQCITTKNYWDIVNLYKPLMHFWYVGVLMQVYIVIPLFLLFTVKILKSNKQKTQLAFKITIPFLTIISLILYLIPTISTAWKFYYFPFRVFELTVAGIIVLWKPALSDRAKKIIGLVSFVVILVLLCSRKEIVSQSTMLLTTVMCTVLLVFCSEGNQYKGIVYKVINFGAEIGKRSYSIYIWHQLIIAFMFYSFLSKHNLLAIICMVVIVSVFSMVSYRLIECNLGKSIGSKKYESAIIIVSGIIAILLCIFSMIIYRHAGVVRDVPELNVYMDNAHRGMHAEYCDRPYSWDNDFEDNDKIKVLVLGNSFGRDFANVLYEWDSNRRIQISYVYYKDDTVSNCNERIEKADYVFYADGPSYEGVPNSVKSINTEKLYIVGNKNFGESNGIIYAKRFSNEYYSSTVEIKDELINHNNNVKEEFGSHYIDMMKPTMVDGIHTRVFTDDKKFISQDCRHLTQAGAQYYARILNLEKIFSVN